MESSIRSDPRSPFVYLRYSDLATAHYLLGSDGDAVDWARKSLQIRRDWIWARYVLVAALGRSEPAEETQQAVRQLLELHPKASIEHARGLRFPNRPDYHDALAQDLRQAGLTD